MNCIRSIGILIFSVIMIMVCLHEASAEICNRVVAIVNDEVITLHELNKRIKEMTGFTPDDLRSQGENMYLETRQSILDLLINDKIAQGKIRELGINITEQHVDAAIEKLKKDNQWTQEDMASKFKREGITYEKYRENIKNDLERVQLINFEVKSKIIIREDEISQYYQEHKKDFSSEGEVHLANIFLMRNNPDDEEENRELYRRGEDILTKLRKGADFGELARKFSQGPGADEGGDLGTFKTDQLEPELRKILEVLPEGGFSDLIIRPNGIQIIKLIEKRETVVKSLEEARDAVYAILYKEDINEKFTSWIKELRESSYTKIIF